MRAKEREQNVGAGYSNEHEGVALLEGAVVRHALIAPASRGCDRGWRAAAMLRSRSTQEMDAAVRASGVTGVTHPCITGLLTPASSPCSPLHQRAASARARRPRMMQCPDCPR